MENESLIWEYIDGTLDSDRRIMVEKKLQNDVDFMKEYHQILKLHMSFIEMDLDAPSMSFDYKVLSQLPKKHIPINIRIMLYKIIPFFVIIFSTPILFMILYKNSIGPSTYFKVDSFANSIQQISTDRYVIIILLMVLMTFIVEIIMHRKRIKMHQ